MGDWKSELMGLGLAKFLSQKAERHGGKVCFNFLHDGRTLTYREVDQATNRLANGLKQSGIGRGDHVAVLSDNRLEQLLTYFALGKLGAVSVPINTAAKGYFLEYFLEQSDSVAIILEPEYLERLAEVAPAAPALATVIVLESLEAGGWAGDLPPPLGCHRIIDFATLLEASDAAVDDAQPSDMVQILYTSGTTGRSKGNMYTHTSMLNWGRQTCGALGLTADDVYLVVFPLFHAGAWLSCVMSTMWAGGTVALGRRFSATRLFEQARGCGATAVFMVSVAGFLAAQPASASDRDHRIKQLCTAPSPPDPLAFEERFGLRLVGGFGLSDYGCSHYRSITAPPSKITSCGSLVPDWEVNCVDELGCPVAPGTPGEILLRCNIPGGAPTGYYKMPEATLESRRDLWFHTGDMGYIDADGYLYFVDRKKDAIRRRGENISSIELETILGRHPDVAAVGFFPVKAQGTEDEVAVALILRPGSNLREGDVVTYCEKHLPKYAVPRYVRIVSTFPFTANGKIEKIKLRNETEAMLSEVWDREAATVAS